MFERDSSRVRWLITPFKESTGRARRGRAAALVEYHVRTARTGSSPAARPASRSRSTRTSTTGSSGSSIETVAGRIPIVAGTGTNSTAKSIKYCESTPKDAGADATPRRHPLLQPSDAAGPLPPLRGDREGRRPPDRRLQRARAGRARTSCPRRWPGWRRSRQVVAVKEASGSMDQVSQIVSSCRPTSPSSPATTR